METTEKENQNNISSTKEETKKEENQNQKKVILPQIKKHKTSSIPSSSYSRNIKSSQSQKDLFDSQNDKWKININHTEKERLMLTKLKLSRLITKINDINYSYRKLLAEKEENLNIIRQAISGNGYTYSENLYKKLEQMLEDAINNKINNTNQNPESKITQNEEDNYNKINEESKKENEDKKEEENINNENDKVEKNNENNGNKENENNDKNYNNEINGEINKENNEKNDNNNENKENNEQEVKNRHNYSMETRGEDSMAKNNSFINKQNYDSRINNNSSILQNNEEDNSIKEINEELNKYQIENGLFEKSVVSTKFYNLLKAKAELATLKHKMIIIKQAINIKEEEINEIRNRAKMKNIIFQSNTLGRNISELHKIKSKNKEMEEKSILKNLQYENLQKKLEYYKKLKESSEADSTNSNENYQTIKNECDKKKELNRNLEEKHSNLKYKLNTLRQSDFKKMVTLKIMHEKIDQISNIKQTIDKQKREISEKEKKIKELKENLDIKLKEYEKSSETRNNGFDEMNKCERQLNYKTSRQKNEFNKVRNEIRIIDKTIIKEIEIYSELNRNNQELVRGMYNKKGKDTKEFMDYLKEEKKNQEKIGKEAAKDNTKKYNISNKFTYNFISKVKKKSNAKKKKKENNDYLPLLQEILVY